MRAAGAVWVGSRSTDWGVYEIWAQDEFADRCMVVFRGYFGEWQLMPNGELGNMGSIGYPFRTRDAALAAIAKHVSRTQRDPGHDRGYRDPNPPRAQTYTVQGGIPNESEPRQKVAMKVAALGRLTVERGAAVGEAANAAALRAKLMAQHNITEQESQRADRMFRRKMRHHSNARIARRNRR